MHTDYIFEKRGGDFVTPLFVTFVYIGTVVKRIKLYNELIANAI